ncbi:MAG: flavodoxin family protein [Desulfarculaceae bacterium]|nr:flavodoxin family protein [Desulfarculaceae bacterium]MCF8072154.1 flavodoxin family protein [Desulfarculaceae bacterium]MCF8100075.1 flavodoxin family protein [Desulfarculaceae bacterium]MCF8118498.1 flavodoxin family protein [Desulfarculaceae bacterium]
MRALVLYGSARGDKGVTGRMGRALIAGLEQGGASVDAVVVKDLEIAPCVACLSCMHRHPGRCAQRDGMDELYPLLQAADLLVMAAPVYTDSMSAQLKAVMDRCVCAMQPFLYADQAGRIRHPMAWAMPSQTVLVSTCSFPEYETFAPLIATVRAQAVGFGGQCVAELCVPGSLALQMAPTELEPHLELIVRAGHELAQEGRVRQTTLAAIQRPPLSVDRFRELAGRYEDWCRKRQAKAEKNTEIC